jgi:hypothetical protein
MTEGVKFKRVDQFTYIEQHRALLNDAYCDSHARHTPSAREYQREWLSRTNEEHWAVGEKCVACAACAKKPRFVWCADFSFCGEYDCGLTLCAECILALAEQVRATEEVRS